MISGELHCYALAVPVMEFAKLTVEFRPCLQPLQTDSIPQLRWAQLTEVPLLGNWIRKDIKCSLELMESLVTASLVWVRLGSIYVSISLPFFCCFPYLDLMKPFDVDMAKS